MSTYGLWLLNNRANRDLDSGLRLISQSLDCVSELKTEKNKIETIHLKQIKLIFEKYRMLNKTKELTRMLDLGLFDEEIQQPPTILGKRSISQMSNDMNENDQIQ